MGAQGKVVQESPVEKHRGIDEGTAVEVEDEFVVGSALRPFDRLRAQGPSCFFMSENLHLEAS